jgi:uracil-DNA glycosylase
MSGKRDLLRLRNEIISCRRCPRLVRWREQVARDRVHRYADQDYWGMPLPGFGDPRARVLLVGLAPAAHGGNRTGRMFTGDESGNWLFRALHKAGFANQAESVDARDGLQLTDCYITAAVRCAPPANKPLATEFTNCRSYLEREIQLLERVRIVVGLGRIGFDAALKGFREVGKVQFDRKPAFAHGAEYSSNGVRFIASFHPSQQNTFTGRLTEPMFNAIFRTVRRHLHRETGVGAR